MSNFKRKSFLKVLIKRTILASSMLATFMAHAVIVTPNLEVITVANVDSTFQTVALQNIYSNAIPVCAYNLADKNNVPVVVRIQNISANSFEVRIQNPTGAQVSGPVTAGDVHCFISDEGSYTLSDGLKYEARTVLSTGKNYNLDWDLNKTENVTNSLLTTFSSPVVLGQVISSNDAEYSTFWSHGGSRTSPPTGTNISVGKQTGIDSTGRANETLGYVVIEAGSGSGSINGVDYAAALGADTISGVPTTTNTYALGKTYKHGITTLTAMDGGDGGWAVLLGVTPLAGSALKPGIDEDKDRGHTTEQVSYWVFDPVNVAELDVTVDDGSVNYTPNTTVVYTAVVTNNGPNVANTVTVNNPLPAGITSMSWTCVHSSAPNCEVTNGAGAINISETTLNVGDSLTYTINVDVPANFSGDLSNTISADSSNFDLLTSNDSATDINTNNADIAVSIDDSSATYVSGATASYSVILSNIGPRTAANAKLVLNDPVDGAIGAWSCAGVNCPVPTSGSGSVAIGAGASDILSGNAITYTVAVTTNSGRVGNLDVTVSGSADNADPVVANNSAIDTDTQTSSADIAVLNSDGALAYLPGTTVAYNVTVSNNGPSDASNVLIANAAPAGAVISGWTCTGCLVTAGSGSISATETTLVSGDSISYVINVAVPFSFVGNLVNIASASAAETDSFNANNSATDTNVSSPDSDGDGVPDVIEIADGTDPNNPNDFKDSDGDGVPDAVELAEGTDPFNPLSILDSDGDKLSDYTERGGDKDGDGIGDEFESSITDTDGNNIKDDLDTDADGDGLTDTAEGLFDTDGDGIPDFLDIVIGGNVQGGDSDNDGLVDVNECAVYPACADSDGDSIPNYADNDDDNDNLLTSVELGAGGGINPDDADGDTVLDYLEPNNLDTDGDGIFNYLDADDDGDNIATIDELDANNDLTGDALNPDDLDKEGIPDYLDADNGDGSGSDIIGSGDSDGDGMSDAQECPAAPMCADSDGDGIPNYMIGNADSDGDGILDGIEIGADPANPIDSDSDGVPDYLENDTLDTDGDGIFNVLDADDDGDGIPTIDELGSGGALNPADSDGDGVPDYLSVTKVQTGLDGGAGAVDPLYLLLIFLMITIIRNRQNTCLVEQKKSQR